MAASSAGFTKVKPNTVYQPTPMSWPWRSSPTPTNNLIRPIQPVACQFRGRPIYFNSTSSKSGHIPCRNGSCNHDIQEDDKRGYHGILPLHACSVARRSRVIRRQPAWL